MSRGRKSAKDVSGLAALVAMRAAPGGAAWRDGAVWTTARRESFAFSTGKQLIREGLVEVVRVDRDGLARCIEINMRGQDLVADSAALLKGGRA